MPRGHWTIGPLAAAFALIGILGTARAHAVVLSAGDGSGNTTPPPDDPGWSHVGRTSDATAVYLGNRWVLTPNHATAGAVVFPAGTFGAEAGSVVRLTNPPDRGLSQFTDIKLYRLLDDPHLPALPLGETTPPIGTGVLLIGAGRNRRPALLGWDIAQVGSNFVWTAVSDPQRADIRGFAVSTSSADRAMRWGDNLVDQHLTLLNGIHGDVVGLTTQFDESGTAAEAHATFGDSGGPMFRKNGGRWELVGMIDALFVLQGQPANTAVMSNRRWSGDQLFVADLTAYRAQIESITGIPEPATIGFAIAGCSFLGTRRCRRRASRSNTRSGSQRASAPFALALARARFRGRAIGSASASRYAGRR